MTHGKRRRNRGSSGSPHHKHEPAPKAKQMIEQTRVPVCTPTLPTPGHVLWTPSINPDICQVGLQTLCFTAQDPYEHRPALLLRYHNPGKPQLALPAHYLCVRGQIYTPCFIRMSNYIIRDGVRRQGLSLITCCNFKN